MYVTIIAYICKKQRERISWLRERFIIWNKSTKTHPDYWRLYSTQLTWISFERFQRRCNGRSQPEIPAVRFLGLNFRQCGIFIIFCNRTFLLFSSGGNPPMTCDSRSEGDRRQQPMNYCRSRNCSKKEEPNKGQSLLFHHGCDSWQVLDYATEGRSASLWWVLTRDDWDLICKMVHVDIMLHATRRDVRRKTTTLALPLCS